MPKIESVIDVGGSSISWNGFILYGDRKSVNEVYRLMFEEARAIELQRRLKEINDGKPQ